MTDPKPFIFTVGGKRYSSLDDLPPELRQKFEEAARRMREQGMLEDRNRDGIPDRFEMLLRIVGWIGKLVGNPQIRERFEQQLRTLNTVGTSRDTT
ncbi:MAG: hypothetical protein ACRESV_08170, partial [Nevskiales bacterium]